LLSGRHLWFLESDTAKNKKQKSMKKVTGPSIEKILREFSKVIISGDMERNLVKFYSVDTLKTQIEVVIDRIDARMWNLPQSVFNNEPSLKKHIILHGWINSEKNLKLISSVTHNCRIKMFADGEVLLEKRKR
jgi:hypothetical protein